MKAELLPPALRPERGTPLHRLIRLLHDRYGRLVELRCVPAGADPLAASREAAVAIVARMALMRQSGEAGLPGAAPAPDRWYPAGQALFPFLFPAFEFDWWADPSCRAAHALTSCLSDLWHGLERQVHPPEAQELLGRLHLALRDAGDRKSCGEFYTPRPIVDYLLDGVGYRGGIGIGRLIDPACGCGVFLVAALERMLSPSTDAGRPAPDLTADGAGAVELLRRIAYTPCLVGVDQSPLAVLLCRVALALALLPAYVRARRAAPGLTLSRLPIFCGDALLPPAGEPLDPGLPTIPRLQAMSGLHAISTLLAETGEDPGWCFAILAAVLDAARDAVGGADPDRALYRRVEAYTGRPPESLSPLREIARDCAAVLSRQASELAAARGRPGTALLATLADAALLDRVKDSILFDCVVGNPPYVRAARLDPAANRRYRAALATARGAYDLTVPFLERGVNWLRPAGRLAFVTTDKWLVNDYGAALRTWLTGRARLAELVDLSACRPFGRPLVSTLLVVLSRRGPDDAGSNQAGPPGELAAGPGDPSDPSIWLAACEGGDLEDLTGLRTAMASAEGPESGGFVPRGGGPVPPGWSLRREREGSLRAGARGRIELHVRGAESAILHLLERQAVCLAQLGLLRGGIMGFEYRAVEPWLTEEADARAGVLAAAGSPGLETDISDAIPSPGTAPPLNIVSPTGAGLPVITAGFVRPWRIAWERSVRLYGRPWRGIRLAPDCPLVSADALTFFRQPKVVLRAVAGRLTAAWDGRGAALLVAVFGLVPRSGVCPYLLLGLLNSSLLDFYCKARFHGGRIPQGSWRFPRSLLAELPIRVPGGDRRQMDGHAAHIADLARRAAHGNTPWTPAALRRLDGLVADYYGVPGDKLAAVYGALARYHGAGRDT